MSSSANRFFPTVGATASVALGGAGGGVDLSHVERAQADTERLGYELAQLESMANGIDSLHDTVGFIVDSGDGIGAAAFAIVKSQTAQILDGTGLDPLTVNMQSFESDSNLDASTTCMLDLKTTAMNIWKAIMKAIREMFEKVQVWFAKMTNTVPSMIKKFEAIKKAANAKTKGLKDDKDIKVSASVVKALGKGKTPKLDRADVLNVPKLAKALGDGVVKDDAGVKAVRTAMLDAVKAVNITDSKSLAVAMKTLGDAAGNSGSASTGTPDKTLNAALGIPEFSILMPVGYGNLAVVNRISSDVKTSTKVDNILKYLDSATKVSDKNNAILVEELNRFYKASNDGVALGKSVAKIDDAEEVEFEAFSTSDIVDICDDSISFLEGITKFKEDNVKATRQSKEFTAALEKAATSLENATIPPPYKTHHTAAVKMVKSVANLYKASSGFGAQVAAELLRTGNSLLSVANSSLSAHK